jgi:hypothetical protein
MSDDKCKCEGEKCEGENSNNDAEYFLHTNDVWELLWTAMFCVVMMDIIVDANTIVAKIAWVIIILKVAVLLMIH